MTIRPILVLPLLLLSFAAPAAALDVCEAEKRVEVSLRMEADLLGPSYLDLVRKVRPRKLYDRTRDPTIPPFNEYGLWRVYAPIRIDVAALIFPWDGGTPYFLGLDNFALPSIARGKIDPRPYERAIMRAILLR